ncbi:MAG: LLM class flavin-dependent oxidoreductase [Sphingobium sp.]
MSTMSTPFRLIWFTSPALQNWWIPDNENYNWHGLGMYSDMAQVLEERGCLDALVFADAPAIPTSYGGNTDIYVKRGLEAASMHDPLPMLSAIASMTRRMGIVATLSTTLYSPRLLAQVIATLDHVSAGRGGWNIVTSIGNDVARNYGLDSLPPPNVRYDQADIFVEKVKELFESANVGSHSSAGGLQMPPLPQKQPVIMQAGGSDRGRDFAARHAEIVIMHRNTVADMKEFRADMVSRMKRIGRDPATCKIFFTIKIVPGRTKAEAEAIDAKSKENAAGYLEYGLVNFASRIGFDLSGLSLDEPLPEHISSSLLGSRGVWDQYTARGAPTLREIALAEAGKESYVAIGTPGQIADQLAEAMDEIGGDGFAVRHTLHPSKVLPVVDQVIPELQARGLLRSEYRYDIFRENLLDPNFVSHRPTDKK